MGFHDIVEVNEAEKLDTAIGAVFGCAHVHNVRMPRSAFPLVCGRLMLMSF
jgi:hypothetical protein